MSVPGFSGKAEWYRGNGIKVKGFPFVSEAKKELSGAEGLFYCIGNGVPMQ